MEETKKESYSHTVFLPRTSFSMKANLTSKELDILSFWNEKRVYFKMLDKNKDNKKYFLHDGPPYANGHIHIGHSLNKILKDFVVKSYSLMGYNTPYIPGWDCHGLPIEQQLLKELKISKRHIDDITSFRKKAREFATKFINIQREEFKRLGVLGDWENPYITMDSKYEANVIRVFIDLYEKGYIERDKKTIYWCPVCETALADAEVEYKDKVSHSIFVKFKITSPNSVLSKYENLYIVIWTTTPWTLPANMAVSVNKEENYVVLSTGGEHLIVAEKLLDNFMKINAIKGEVKCVVKGEEIVGIGYEAPLVEYLQEEYRSYKRKVIYTDFVDMTTGSGVVHIAPGHGEEDYFAGKKWNIEIFCPVDESGRFTEEVSEFKGKYIFDANEEIIEILRKKGLLLSHSDLSHSYPHCWRCKKPVIFRATEQWFLKIDKNSLREKLVSECLNVKWVPDAGYERITSMIKQRPDWCLSRQRYWGTPIVSFKCKKCGKITRDFNLLRKIADRIEKEGSDFWFRDDLKNIIGLDYRCECGSDEFEKEKDILDVWLDSGVSWYEVCKNREAYYPADLYLEGSDQHRGWFQTSLIPSVALNGIAPYKTVLTHGFVLDEEGKAMHKSLGNVVAPEDVIKKYGAEILRLWVALSNWNDDVRISDKLLSIPVDMYRKIRNTFRYLLGNLNGFDVKKKLNYDDMIEIDKYMSLKLGKLNRKVIGDYREFKYRSAIKNISEFCIIDLSSFYLDVSKDRLYTMALKSRERLSAQSVMYDILKSLVILSSPILSFTCEELWQVFRKEVDGSLSESVFLNHFPDLNDGSDIEIEKKWDRIRELRDIVLKEIEEVRRQAIIGSSLEAKIIIYSDKSLFDFVKNNLEDIKIASIVSQAEVKKIDNGIKVEVLKADGLKCPRCWQWSVEIGKNPRWPQLCPKCANAMEENLKDA